MNILILTTHLDRGGVSRYVVNLAKGLAFRHKVQVASFGGRWEDKLKNIGCEHIFIPLNTKFIFSIRVFQSFLD